MAETDLLVTCPECHSCPMATVGPLPRRYGEMMFRCSHCRHREVFNLKHTDPQKGFFHRPYDVRYGRWGKHDVGA